MYFSALGSKQLLLTQVEEIINDATTKIKIYDKQAMGNRFTFIMPPDPETAIIERKLIFKVGFKLTQRNTIDSRIIKGLS